MSNMSKMQMQLWKMCLHEFEAGLYVFKQWKEEVNGVWEISLNNNYIGNYISSC